MVKMVKILITAVYAVRIYATVSLQRCQTACVNVVDRHVR